MDISSSAAMIISSISTLAAALGTQWLIARHNERAAAADRAFKLRMADREIYELPRRQALLDYLDKLGRYAAMPSDVEAARAYFAAFSLASVYVDDGARDAMERVNELFHRDASQPRMAQDSIPFLENPRVAALRQLIADELARPLSPVPAPLQTGQPVNHDADHPDQQQRGVFRALLARVRAACAYKRPAEVSDRQQNDQCL